MIMNLPQKNYPNVRMSAQSKDDVELLVYFAQCPEHGPEHRVYDEEDIHGAGGVHALEMEMERETYWFVRLGIIQGEQREGGIE